MWRADSLEKTLMLGKIEGRRGRGWKRMKWLHDIIGSMDMSVSKLWQLVKDCLACRSPRGHKEWDASQQLNNNIQQANSIYGLGFSSAWLVWASTVWFYSLCKNALPWEHPTDKAHRGKLFGSSSHSYRKAKPGQHSSLVIQISLPFPNKRLPGGSDSKESACNAGDTGLIHGSDPLEKGMATHSSILAWRIPWTEKPGWLQSMGLQTVGQDWATKQTHTHTHKLSTCLSWVWFSREKSWPQSVIQMYTHFT